MGSGFSLVMNRLSDIVYV